MTDGVTYDVIVRNGDVVFPGDGPRPVDIAIAGDRVAALVARGAPAPAAREIDAHGLTIFPGVIDPHVHQDDRTHTGPLMAVWSTMAR